MSRSGDRKEKIFWCGIIEWHSPREREREREREGGRKRKTERERERGGREGEGERERGRERERERERVREREREREREKVAISLANKYENIHFLLSYRNLGKAKIHSLISKKKVGVIKEQRKQMIKKMNLA